MGSLLTSPKLPTDPRPARVLGIRPSIPSPWPSTPQKPALGRVRLPISLAGSTLPALIYALSPRDAAAPSPAMLLGGLLNLSIGAVPTPAWTLTFLSAATLAAIANSKRFNFGHMGVTR